ncbi:PAS domain S-box protein [Sulfurirhabdus autotrophica]|uniref:histidine kinase n=1 Tax=Sulfurirhabdus autotrophica TaxID=1706046 RepID=A0A4R3Y1R3_9PROT|nr:PAS domain S-box protein [Sulfurirhabdus autotrophica]TCV84164.1 PAS domain S-box-containing protein [Sulfurirhabdus autotrophica]
MKSKRHNFGRLLVGLLVLIGLTATYFGWRYASDSAMSLANDRFQIKMIRIKSAIHERMLAYKQVLRGGVGLFNASSDVSRQEWHDYVNSLQLNENYPGIQGMGFAKWIAPANLADHITQIRREGFPDYIVKPAGARTEYTSIIYLEPFDARNQRAFGYDMFSEVTRRTAMEMARDSGKTAISGKVILLQETKSDVQNGFLMYLPVYRGAAPANVTQRRAALVGYVYSPFRMNDLMQGVLGKTAPDVALQIYDGLDMSASKEMFKSDDIKSNHHSLFTDTREIEFNGKVWTLRFSSLPAFESDIDTGTPEIIAISGLALTALLSLLLWSLLSTRERAFGLANAMTSAVRESEERFRSVVDTAADGIVVVSENGIIESCNAAAQNIFGYSSEEMVGNNFNMLMSGVDSSQGEGFFERFLRTNENRSTGIGQEMVGLRKNGISFPMDLSVGEIHTGNQRKFTGMVRDITEQKLAQQKLNDQVRFITELQDTIPTPVYFKDVAGHYLGFNRAFEEFFGIDRDNMLGQSVSALYQHYPDVAAFHLQKDAELFNDLKPQSFEATIPTRQGERYVMYSKAPFFQEDGTLAGLIGVVYDVTERKQAEEVLQKTMRLQRAILESASYAIISTALDGTILLFNPAAERMLGYKAEELIGKATPAIIHLPEEVVAHAKIISEELGQNIEPGFEVFVAKTREGSIDENEWTYVRKDGSHVPVLLTVTAQRDENNEITGFLGIASDISERKAFEVALRDSEERYRMMAEHSSDMISRFSTDGTLSYVSPASATLLGYESSAMLGKSLFEWIHPDDREMVRQKLMMVLDNYVLDTLTCQVRSIEGHYIWMETSLRGLKESAPGGDRLIVGVSRDVTERVQATANLNRFKNILDNTLDMLFMFEPDTLRFVYLNKGAVEKMGYTSEELLQMAPYQIKPLIPEKKFREMIAPLLSGEKQSLNFETVHRCKDGSDFPVEIFLQLVREVDGHGLFIAIVRDITERKKVDRLKNEFVSTVSHELRTPLTSIRGALGLVAGGVAGELSIQAKSLIDIAYKNSERLVRLINDILDIEKIESGKMVLDLQRQDLMPIIEHAVEANRAYGEAYGVTFKITSALDGVKVEVDQDRLLQVMTNLLSNAAKFSPANSQVEIAVRPGKYGVRVMVIDKGTGIPETFRSSIFQKFSQADSSDTRQKGGTGLGLSISKAIVEKMGGEIGFETKEGMGSVFYFELPESCETGICLTRIENALHGNLLRVLICEDDEDIAVLLGLILSGGGYASDVAHNAMQAKALLQKNHYDAMTLDIGLPGQDGIALIRELRAQEATAHLPIVVVSAQAEKGRAEINDGYALVGWLDKPIDRTNLLKQLNELVINKDATRIPVILHIEDDPDIRQIVSSIGHEIAEFDHASTLTEATEKLCQKHYDLIVLDLGLPDGSGMAVMPLLKKLNHHTPVMIFSGANIAQKEAGQVASVLVKSRTSNQELLDTITQLVTQKVKN